jgi:hypothetical protein
MATCSTNYVCVPKWYVAADVDVIATARGPSAVDLNITCIPGTGSVQFQIKDQNDAWFTPVEASHTVVESALVRLPRANMPDVRIMAIGDATFSVAGDLN